jgi:hypothetical protein
MSRRRTCGPVEFRAVPPAGLRRRPPDDREGLRTPAGILLAAWLAEVSSDALRAGQGRVGSLPEDGEDASPSKLEPAG